MPLSGAERNRIYSEKLKAKLGERHIKEQDAKRKAESRMKDVEKSREKERRDSKDVGIENVQLPMLQTLRLQLSHLHTNLHQVLARQLNVLSHIFPHHLGKDKKLYRNWL
jgi:hypothetical protein